MSINLNVIHPNCREFAKVVDSLLLKCRHQGTSDTTMPYTPEQNDVWGPRTWTLTEFEDMIYSSYKPMRQGRITRPPRREIVMDIANYLNCSLAERNQLLLAAHSTPVAPYLTGEKLQKALQVAINVAQNIPLITIVINRDWHMHYLNQHALTLNGLTMDDVKAIPSHKLNVLNLLFDPALPLYPHLIQNKHSWVQMVRQTIYGFKMANLLCQFEPWYQNLICQLMALPEFEQHWHAVQVDTTIEPDINVQSQTISAILEISVSNTKSARLRPLLISVGYFQFDFPQIVAFMPIDDESRSILQDMGIPVSDNSFSVAS